MILENKLIGKGQWDSEFLLAFCDMAGHNFFGRSERDLQHEVLSVLRVIVELGNIYDSELLNLHKGKYDA